MRSVAPMRTAKIGDIVMSAVLCVLGILLIIIPDFSMSVLGIVCGVTMILFGGIRLLGFFSRDLFRLAFQYDLAFGILMLALGVVMLVRPGALLNFICLALGVCILADGLFKVQTAVEAKRFGLRTWWLLLALALIACAFGLVLLLRPASGGRALCILAGITLLAEGVLNLGTMLTAVKIIRHQQPDYIDAVYEEKKD